MSDIFVDIRHNNKSILQINSPSLLAPHSKKDYSLSFSGTGYYKDIELDQSLSMGAVKNLCQLEYYLASRVTRISEYIQNESSVTFQNIDISELECDKQNKEGGEFTLQRIIDRMSKGILLLTNETTNTFLVTKRAISAYLPLTSFRDFQQHLDVQIASMSANISAVHNQSVEAMILSANELQVAVLNVSAAMNITAETLRAETKEFYNQCTDYVNNSTSALADKTSLAIDSLTSSLQDQVVNLSVALDYALLYTLPSEMRSLNESLKLLEHLQNESFTLAIGVIRSETTLNFTNLSNLLNKSVDMLSQKIQTDLSVASQLSNESITFAHASLEESIKLAVNDTLSMFNSSRNEFLDLNSQLWIFVEGFALNTTNQFFDINQVKKTKAILPIAMLYMFSLELDVLFIVFMFCWYYCFF